MAKPRIPSNILELKGSFKKNPQRKRINEPSGEKEFGEPPEHLSEDVKACWLEIVSMVHPGVLCYSDRLAMEHTAHLLNKLRVDDWNRNPTLMVRFETMLAKFGMSPSDRSRVKIEKPNENKNPYAEFGS